MWTYLSSVARLRATTKCIEEKDCVARFRDFVRKDLYRNIENHEKGQFHIPIVEIFERPGRSDLAVVQLKHPIEEHEDYGLGAELIPIKLAEDPPKSGDVILSSFLIISTHTFFFIFRWCRLVAGESLDTMRDPVQSSEVSISP